MIVSVNILNARRRTVVVVPLSSSPRAGPPVMIPVTCDGQPAVAVTDQIRAVAKERLRARVGVISEDELAAINDGLRQIINMG